MPIRNSLKLKSSCWIILADIAEENDLGPTNLFSDPRMEELLGKAKTEEERMNVIANLPFVKLKRIVEKISQTGKIEMLPEEIQKGLSIEEEKAKIIAQEIEEKVFQGEEEKIEEEREEERPIKDPYREPIE